MAINKNVKKLAAKPAPKKTPVKASQKKAAPVKKTLTAKKQETRPARSNGKHPGGRPTKYVESIINRLPDMFSEGQSIVEVCVELGISVATYFSWQEQYPEFLEASTRGKLISRAWWEKQGRENLFDESEYDAEKKISSNKKFNDRLWSKNMGCRFKVVESGLFDWTDKQEVAHSGNINVIIDKDDANL